MKKLLCWFGFHKWVLEDVDPDDKDGPQACLRCDRHRCKATRREEWAGSVWEKQERMRAEKAAKTRKPQDPKGGKP